MSMTARKGEPMTREAKLMSGITLIILPTIQYGGYFLLTSLISKSSGYMENPLRQNFFRAGHAHAGVIVLLSLVCHMLTDSATLPVSLRWFVRIGVPFAAVLIFGGVLLFRVSPDCNSSQRSGLSDLPWSSCSCRGRHFARIGLLKSCVVHPVKANI